MLFTRKANTPVPLLLALLIVLVSAGTALAQTSANDNPVVSTADTTITSTRSGETLAGLLARQGCDPNQFAAVAGKSNLSITDLTSSIAGREIVLPARCSEPPDEATAHASQTLIAALAIIKRERIENAELLTQNQGLIGRAVTAESNSSICQITLSDDRGKLEGLKKEKKDLDALAQRTIDSLNALQIQYASLTKWTWGWGIAAGSLFVGGLILGVFWTRTSKSSNKDPYVRQREEEKKGISATQIVRRDITIPNDAAATAKLKKPMSVSPRDEATILLRGINSIEFPKSLTEGVQKPGDSSKTAFVPRKIRYDDTKAPKTIHVYVKDHQTVYPWVDRQKPAPVKAEGGQFLYEQPKEHLMACPYFGNHCNVMFKVPFGEEQSDETASHLITHLCNCTGKKWENEQALKAAAAKHAHEEVAV